MHPELEDDPRSGGRGRFIPQRTIELDVSTLFLRTILHIFFEDVFRGDTPLRTGAIGRQCPG